MGTSKKNEIHPGEVYTFKGKYFIAGYDNQFWYWESKWKEKRPYREYKRVQDVSCREVAKLLKVTAEQLNILYKKAFNPAKVLTKAEMATKGITSESELQRNGSRNYRSESNRICRILLLKDKS